MTSAALAFLGASIGGAIPLAVFVVALHRQEPRCGNCGKRGGSHAPLRPGVCLTFP